jgi:hypothetical protein
LYINLNNSGGLPEYGNTPTDVILEGVPIEYMTCDAEAFEEGDKVVVQFSGDWETAKVIGFAEGPKVCWLPYFEVSLSFSNDTDGNVYSFRFPTDYILECEKFNYRDTDWHQPGKKSKLFFSYFSSYKEGSIYTIEELGFETEKNSDTDYILFERATLEDGFMSDNSFTLKTASNTPIFRHGKFLNIDYSGEVETRCVRWTIDPATRNCFCGLYHTAVFIDEEIDWYSVTIFETELASDVYGYIQTLPGWSPIIKLKRTGKPDVLRKYAAVGAKWDEMLKSWRIKYEIVR